MRHCKCSKIVPCLPKKVRRRPYPAAADEDVGTELQQDMGDLAYDMLAASGFDRFVFG